jgi:hypothetical protein
MANQGLGRSTVATVQVNLNTSGCGSLADGVIVIQGIFDPTGEKLLRLNPVRRYSYRAGQTPQQQVGRFAVIVSYTDGKVTRVPFDALVADDSGVTTHGFFEVVIPVCGKIATIRIIDSGGQKTFAQVAGSQILSP